MGPWFFLSPEAFQQTNVCLPRDVLRHLKVLRLRKGDLLILSDGKGRSFQARLERLEEHKGEAVILGAAVSTNEPVLDVTLFPGITKGEKMDQVIRQSVELGVKKIVPVLAERSVLRLSRQKKEEKGRRWQNVARSAAGQCRRSLIPPVTLPFEFDEMLLYWQKEQFKAIIVPWEEEKNIGLRQTLETLPGGLQKIGLFIGPEGGISEKEMGQMRKISGVHAVALGPRILRAETAPIAVLSILMYYYDW